MQDTFQIWNDLFSRQLQNSQCNLKLAILDQKLILNTIVRAQFPRAVDTDRAPSARAAANKKDLFFGTEQTSFRGPSFTNPDVID